MEIEQVLKQATALKKENGFSSALDFLTGSYDENKPDDLPRLLDKIYTYFYRDLDNRRVKEFVAKLINSKVLEQYSGLLTTYYWILKDYESYRLTIMNQISKVNPNNPWKYCYDLKELLNSLCNYYSVMGLTKEDNAIEYLYNLINSTYFEVAGELMMYEHNFTRLHSRLRSGSELKFHYPEKLIPISESIEGWFNDEADNGCQCLKSIQCTTPTEKVIELIKSIYYNIYRNITDLSKEEREMYLNTLLENYKSTIDDEVDLLQS